MNEKERELWRLVDVVAGCCSVDAGDVLGRSRRENVVMTRCMLVAHAVRMGYSVTTAARLLKRTAQAVRHMLASDQIYRRVSRAYRVANAEVMKRCGSVFGE